MSDDDLPVPSTQTGRTCSSSLCQELLQLLLSASDEQRRTQIERTLAICLTLDTRWWNTIGAGKSAEDLLTYFNRPTPRRLPPRPYEDLP
jgi:hypothetical protein